VEIADDGPGIEPRHQEAVFGRYKQLQSCALTRSGHGLGLAGARILARCLGGDISVQSRVGSGAAFRLTLPLALDSLHFDPETGRRTQPPKEDPP
jgi:signal transduction histidine kinase